MCRRVLVWLSIGVALALMAIGLAGRSQLMTYPPIRKVNADRLPIGMLEADVESLLGGPANVPPGVADFWIRDERREGMKAVKAWRGDWKSRTKWLERTVIIAFTADGRVAQRWIRDRGGWTASPWMLRSGWPGSGVIPTPTLTDRFRDWLDL